MIIKKKVRVKFYVSYCNRVFCVTRAWNWLAFQKRKCRSRKEMITRFKKEKKKKCNFHAQREASLGPGRRGSGERFKKEREKKNNVKLIASHLFLFKHFFVSLATSHFSRADWPSLIFVFKCFFFLNILPHHQFVSHCFSASVRDARVISVLLSWNEDIKRIFKTSKQKKGGPVKIGAWLMARWGMRNKNHKKKKLKKK